jgi:hypothetical protein
LRHHYQVRLTDLWRGELTLRELRVLLEYLPDDSATARAISGAATGPLAGWTLTDALLGRLVDEVAAHRWQWESVHTKKGRPSRKAPASVLPELRPPREPSGPDAEVIPLVSPHRLGNFVHDTGEE